MLNYLQTFRAFHGQYCEYTLGRFCVNYLDIIFLMAIVNITDSF